MAALWKQLIAELSRARATPSIGRFQPPRTTMSKRTRHGDNSKRQQPVQQQRAEASRLATNAKNTPARGEKQATEPRQANKSKG
ncbi:MAG: hypothetical protein NVS2B4_07680 [Ramlibacter sp.]